MFELFTYDFIVRAMLAGVCTAMAAALVGNFIVAARQSVISDMLAHVALTGVGLGMLVGFAPGFFAGVAAVIGGVFLWFLTRQTDRANDAVSMLLLTGGLAIALLLSHAARDTTISFEAFLFGSILTISQNELIVFACACFVIIVVFIGLWQPFLRSVFDSDFARAQSRFAPLYEISILISTAALVAVALKVIGGLLVGALLVIPVLTAQHVAQSFRGNVIGSMICGVIGVVCGIASSFYLDVPASSAIVLSLIGLFILTYCYQKIRS